MDIGAVIPHPGRANHADHAPVFLLQQRFGQGEARRIVEHPNLTRSRVENKGKRAPFSILSKSRASKNMLSWASTLKAAVPQISHSERALVEEPDKLVPRPRLFLSL